ncbi:MAG TPA: DUF308 domain-containing protein [Methanocorpusculum sp.]|nr:DUF308 domain-containing protein [Methanocorpusculum sp.]
MKSYMSDEKITPNVEFGATIGRSVLLIILGILICVLVNSSWGGALTAVAIPTTICAIMLVFVGIAMLCGGTSFGGAGAASIILGILVIILGIIALFNTAAFEAFLVYFLAASALVSGIFNVISGFTVTGTANRAVNIIAGILGILLGILIFVAAFNLTPWITAIFIVYAAAIFMLVFGILSIIQAIMMKKEMQTGET